jgi:hypothetical protein
MQAACFVTRATPFRVVRLRHAHTGTVVSEVGDGLVEKGEKSLKTGLNWLLAGDLPR